jgi:uncharacterized protein (DUF58 family)
MSFWRRATGAMKAMRLTRRGAWMLALGVAALLAAYVVGRTELVYLGSLLVLLPLGAIAFLRLRPVSLAVERRFSPDVLSAGRTATVSVQVRNLGKSFTAEGSWRDVWPWPVARPGGLLPALAPGSRLPGVVLRYDVTPPRRGVFSIGPILATWGDPFSLAQREVVIGEEQTVLVVPEVVPLTDILNLVAADDGSGRTLQRQVTSGVDDLMAREYRTGDALRRVHWRASAHRGDLMVRQEEQRSHAEARILLDTRWAGYRDASLEMQPESESLEWAVRFTASLALHLKRHGFAVHVVETGPRQLAPTDGPQEFLASLAELRLTTRPLDDSALTFAPGISRSLGSAFVVLAEAEDELIEHLVRARVAFDTAVAFLITRGFPALAEPLRAAGWACIAVDQSESLDDAWVHAALEREAQRAAG